MLEYTANIEDKDRRAYELDPVDSTVRYEMMKLCTYQIIVADAADAVSVNFFGRCKFLQI